MLKRFGPCPAGYSHQDLERFLDLLYGMFSHCYTTEELRQVIVSDPFDRAEPPRSFKLMELAEWLEAILTGAADQQTASDGLPSKDRKNNRSCCLTS